MDAASRLTHLECSSCAKRHDADAVQTVCRACGRTLLARYDLDAAREDLAPARLAGAPRGLWRWAPILPVRDPARRVTLGEGGTPLLPVPRIAQALGLPRLVLKEEGLNPTGSFKARGLCAAVARAAELGVRRFAVPTAGNAGVAAAAYAAAAGCEARVFVPEDAPARVVENARRLGATVVPVKGLISDAGAACRAWVGTQEGVLDVSTLKEPYRAEGKKTMGLEIAEGLGWQVPDVVVYPTGGGTGVVGLWKAFHELGRLGLTDGSLPRIVSVQAEGCAPVVAAFREGKAEIDAWKDASTAAAGLRVPRPFADALVLRALRESKGAAVAVSEDAIARSTAALAASGVLASPEGGAALAGLRELVDRGDVRRDERVVLFQTGSALAY